MARYRIEVYHMGELVRCRETDAFAEALKTYRYYNQQLDYWTQLYIDGLTGSKAWMDRQMYGRDPAANWRGFKFSDGGTKV